MKKIISLILALLLIFPNGLIAYAESDSEVSSDFNFYISALDQPIVYVDGQKINITGADNVFGTHIDGLDEESVITVKATDSNNKEGIYAGLKVIYKINGQWYGTNEDWEVYVPSQGSTPPPNIDGLKWYDIEYEGDNNWESASVVDEYNKQMTTPAAIEFEWGNANWIWSSNYGKTDGGLDSPVYFRNTLYEKPETFTVTFEDFDNTELKVETVASGGDATPPVDPSRSGYTFDGWNGDYMNVTSDITITATYTEITEEAETFTVTFEDYDNTELKVETVASGGDATPPVNPSRSGYTFDGWNGDYMNVTSDITIIATYTEITEEETFTVTFEDYDNTELKVEVVASGDDATPPVNPSRSGYTFDGWNGDYMNVTSDITIIATYTEITEEETFTVTFEDYDNTELKVEVVASGDDATPPVNPSRSGYTFDGWNGDYMNVTSDITIIATYTEITVEEETFTVTFEDYDNTELKVEIVASGDDATPPVDPSRSGYTFDGWNGDYMNVTSDITIIATYTEITVEEETFTVTFEDYDNTELKVEIVASGDDATPPVDPSRSGYTFDGWNGDYMNVTSDITIIATYTEITVEEETFTVTFEDYDNTELKVETVASGDDATPPVNPSRSGYTFDGWNGDYMNVTSDITIIATYTVITRTTGGGGTTRTTSSVNAVSDRFTILENEVLEIETSELMENDTNADEFVSVQDAENGTVTLDGTTVTFTPDENFIGRAYFYYTIADGNDQDNGLVIITVEEGVEINPSDTPLGNGNPNAFIVIEPEIIPLGIIDYSMPYIMGYPDITFRAEREVTRAEMAAIFARILGLDLSNLGEPMYEDVNPEDWYYKYIQSVTRVGLFSGYSDDLFKPNRPVTHAEIASAFSKYWELRGIEVESDGDYYSDISGHWAEAMINRLYNAGISVSYANGTFKPDAFTTRVELVVLVNRSLNRAEDLKDIPSFSDVLQSYWGYGAIEAANGYQEPESVRLTE